MKQSNPRDSILNRLLSGLSSTEIGILVVFVVLVLVTAATFLRSSDPGTAPSPVTPSADRPVPPQGAAPEPSPGPLPPSVPVPTTTDDSDLAARNAALTRLLEDARAEIFGLEQQLDAPVRAPSPSVPSDPELADLRRRLRDTIADLVRSRASEAEAEEQVALLQRQVSELENRADVLASDLQAALERARAAESTPRSDARPPGGLEATEHPSCWYDSAGNPEYVWDVTVHLRGLLLRPGPAPANRHLQPDLPVAQTQTGRYLSDEAFLAQTQRLYEYSVSQACRFHVRLFNNARSVRREFFAEKERVVQQHFLVHRDD